MDGLQKTAATPTGWQQLRRFVRTWYWAARPFTLSASVVPILLGSALAFRDGESSPLLVLLMLVASMFVQATANLVDEYSDHARPEGKDKLVAPYKVIALGLLSPKAVKRGAMVIFGIATLIGLYLVSVAGWPVLALALSSAAVAYFYAGGSRPLGTLGLGQPLVFVFMGPVMVMGAYYVNTGLFTYEAFLLSLPVGCTVTAILAANDLRDMEEDVSAGKRTIVTAYGRKAGRLQWAALIAIAFVAAVVLAAAGHPGLTALLALAAIPHGLKTAKLVRECRARPDMALAMRMTARLHLWFGLSLAAGVALARYWNI